ncbi:MAG: oligosaccharide flippase family protein [Candidatus Pacearchaeota archaeon]|nr:oligosaccharide flippase family protein [Candidatus Pacearchaeota archaeon]
MKIHDIFRSILTLWSFQSIAAIVSALFYVLMAHLLSIEHYGLFYALVSFSYLFTIPQETIRTIVARACVKAQEKKKIKYIFLKYLKTIMLLGIFTFFIFILAIPYLQMFLKANFFSLLIIGLSIILVFIIPVVWGVLQGTLRFRELGINSLIENFAKICTAFFLVSILDLKIFGALIAIPFSILCAFFAGLFSIKDILKEKKEKFTEKGSFKYAIASLLLFFLIAIIFVVPIFLARYFFSEKISGLYSGISMLTAGLFFVAMSAERVMLPIIAKEKRKNQKKILSKVALIIVLLFLGSFILASVFPNKIVSILLGKKYIEVAYLLKYMVVIFAFFSFSTLFIFYNLSRNRNKKISLRVLISSAFMLVALLILFHKTLLQFITMVLITHIIMFLLLLIITLRR